jgi:hypothetical protein
MIPKPRRRKTRNKTECSVSTNIPPLRGSGPRQVVVLLSRGKLAAGFIHWEVAMARRLEAGERPPPMPAMYYPLMAQETAWRSLLKT